jgi:hypothetical protein
MPITIAALDHCRILPETNMSATVLSEGDFILGLSGKYWRATEVF